jgi:hypothetical protein
VQSGREEPYLSYLTQVQDRFRGDKSMVCCRSSLDSGVACWFLSSSPLFRLGNTCMSTTRAVVFFSRDNKLTSSCRHKDVIFPRLNHSIPSSINDFLLSVDRIYIWIGKCKMFTFIGYDMQKTFFFFWINDRR